MPPTQALVHCGGACWGWDICSCPRLGLPSPMNQDQATHWRPSRQHQSRHTQAKSANATLLKFIQLCMCLTLGHRGCIYVLADRLQSYELSFSVATEKVLSNRIVRKPQDRRRLHEFSPALSKSRPCLRMQAVRTGHHRPRLVGAAQGQGAPLGRRGAPKVHGHPKGCSQGLRLCSIYYLKHVPFGLLIGVCVYGSLPTRRPDVLEPAMTRKKSPQNANQDDPGRGVRAASQYQAVPFEFGRSVPALQWSHLAQERLGYGSR